MKCKTNVGMPVKGVEGNRLSSSIPGMTTGKITKQSHRTKGSSIASLKSERPEQKKTSNKTSKCGNPRKLSRLQKTTPAVPTVLPRTSPEGSEKLKLQLFPIDEVTREALEKEKINPYLELSLGRQKKISSVVEHLRKKWGTLNSATGELMLFPFSVQLENLSLHKRWTWRDYGTTASDVYTAVGSPSVFRLRYGWLSILEPNVCKIPLTSLHTEDNLMARENGNMHATGGEPSKGHPLMSNEPLNHESGTPTMLDKAIEAVDKDTLTTCNGASLSWLDSISNISFGALLSQASPTKETSQGHSLPKTHFHQIPNCDTFDAEIAAYTAQQQGTCISSEVSSIFDAEQARHTFPLQQPILSDKDILPSSKDYPCMSDNQNMETNLMRFHTMTEFGSQVVHTQTDTSQEHTSGQQPHTVHDGRLESIAEMQPDPQDSAIAEMQPDPRDSATEESTAKLQLNANDWGMMTMFGPESLGPWQYTAPSSAQIVGGDNVGLSGLYESSLDAFQSFSIF